MIVGNLGKHNISLKFFYKNSFCLIEQKHAWTKSHFEILYKFILSLEHIYYCVQYFHINISNSVLI